MFPSILVTLFLAFFFVVVLLAVIGMVRMVGMVRRGEMVGGGLTF